VKRFRALLLAGCGLWGACGVDAGAERSAQSSSALAGPIVLPIEVMPTDVDHFTPATPADAYAVERAFTLSAGDLNDLKNGGTLWIQGHGLGYRDGYYVNNLPVKDGKAGVQLNDGPWVDLTNTGAGITVQTPDRLYGGIGGGFRTVRLSVQLTQLCTAPGGIFAGDNVIRFRFNGTDGTASGFRILAFNLLSPSGNPVLGAAEFQITDPLTWLAPLPGAADIAEGQRLFTKRHSLVAGPGGASMAAACSDCHARDGRDLEYYAFSNDSIVTRSVFHGLTIAQGQQIASYVRSHPDARRGRPWNPPYQPGVGLDATPARWAAGAGLDAVLPISLASSGVMLNTILPNRASAADIAGAIRGTGLPATTLNLRQLPLAIQLPDWNSWLPEVHPLDLWGDCYWNGSGDGTFDPQSTFAAGNTPNAVASGDFDGDGDADLAVANSNDATVGVLLSDGQGGFGAQTSFAVGSSPVGVAVGDFDANGTADLAVANMGSDTVSILSGDGLGTFSVTATLTAGDGPRAVVAADIDSDGKLDLAVPNMLSDDVSLFRGQAGGAFSAAFNFTVGDAPFSAAVADFNGDANNDVVVANGSSSDLTLLLASGGTFIAQPAIATGGAPRSVAAADLNGDGKQDLAVNTSANFGVGVWLGNGDGTFAALPGVPSGGSQPYKLVIDDFDADARLDVAVANYLSANVSVLRGNGDGTFAAPALYGTGTTPVFVASGDFDGDGSRDLAVANQDSANVSVLTGNRCTPAAISDIVPSVYEQVRAAIPTAANLPGTLGDLEDATRNFIGELDNDGAWTQQRNDVMDYAVRRGYSHELVKKSLAQWMGVKYWEIMHDFALEGLGPTIFPNHGEVLSWPMGGHQAVHPIAPHVTSENRDYFRSPDQYDHANDACYGAIPACPPQLHSAQTQIKGDYDSTAWYHLQIVLNGGARNLTHNKAVRPWDMAYSLKHVDDLPRDILNGGEPAPPWEGLRYLATLIKAYQERNNGKGPAATGWALRDVSPRLLVGNYNGKATQVELLSQLDVYEPGLRLKVTDAFLTVYLEVTDPVLHTDFAPGTWPTCDPNVDFETASWWKVDPATYTVTAAPPVGNTFAGVWSFQHHADYTFRAIPLLRSLGADCALVNTLIDRGEALWTTQNAEWEALRVVCPP
jgi:hypothetical protein